MSYTEMVLLALLLVSNAWWAWQVQKLVNKVLSRSYYEYKQAEKIGAKPAPSRATTPPAGNTQALQALDQLTRQFSPFP